MAPVPWIAAMRESVGVGDYIKFNSSLGVDRHGLIVKGGSSIHVRVLLLEHVTSDTFHEFSLQPITATVYPMAYHSKLVELISVGDYCFVQRSSIIDVVFVLPIKELESGAVFMAGCQSMYFQRFEKRNKRIASCQDAFYFCRYIVEPFSVRLFQSLNTLASHIKRAMHHGPASSISSRSFRLPFSMESFLYLQFKLPTAVSDYLERREKTVIYYNTLEVEARTTVVHKNFLKIITPQSLRQLRSILGEGIGLGLAKERPTKKRPWGFCTINSILTSVEVSDGDDLEDDASGTDGIFLMYTEEKRVLTCSVRYTKIPVNSVEDVTLRLPHARVDEAESGAYLNAWFKLDGVLHEIIAIQGADATCIPVGGLEPNNEVVLPLDLVSNLVRSFGT